MGESTKQVRTRATDAALALRSGSGVFGMFGVFRMLGVFSTFAALSSIPHAGLHAVSLTLRDALGLHGLGDHCGHAGL